MSGGDDATEKNRGRGLRVRRECCVRVIRRRFSEEVTFEQRPEGESLVKDIWGREFLVKGTANANVLK